MGANWLKPLVVIRRPDRSDDRAARSGSKVRIDALDLRPVGRGCYIGEFTALNDGRVYVALNDATTPIAPGLFYRNNRGRAEIRIGRSPGSADLRSCGGATGGRAVVRAVALRDSA
jgi:hypothetical protein